MLTRTVFLQSLPPALYLHQKFMQGGVVDVVVTQNRPIDNLDPDKMDIEGNNL